MKISPMELCERVTDGEAIPTNIKPGVKKSLANFVGVVRKLRRAAERVSVSSLFSFSYRQHYVLFFELDMKKAVGI